jgi:hypothetical protein
VAAAYKVLGQVNPAATTLSTLYTVPGGTETIVSTVTVANIGVAMTYRIAVRPNGAAIDPKHSLIYDGNLGVGEAEMLTLGLTLDAADVISVYASHANAAFNCFGSEIT